MVLPASFSYYPHSAGKMRRQHLKQHFFIFIFPENRAWHLMQIVSEGDNLHEMSSHVFWRKKSEENCWNDICSYSYSAGQRSIRSNLLELQDDYVISFLKFLVECTYNSWISKLEINCITTCLKCTQLYGNVKRILYQFYDKKQIYVTDFCPECILKKQNKNWAISLIF